MNIIEGVAVSNHCDYSFGDQSGCIGRVPGSFMKQADPCNEEFSALVKSKKWMTIFIDNIRLYNREIKCTNTSINNDIHDLIPDNVKAIYGVNAVGFGDKVHPFPYGVQRIIHPSDNRIAILHDAMEKNVTPTKLLYINHAEHTNISERGNIREKFAKLKYATVDNRVSYDIYCKQIQKHKFMICPQGNGVDCHRNWEVLYLKRVPIMKRTSYLQELYKDYPVLWVDDYAEVTKTLLTNSEDLYDRARNLDNNLLDLYSVFNRAVKRAKNS